MIVLTLHDTDAAEVLNLLYHLDRHEWPGAARAIDALKCALDLCDCGRGKEAT